MEDDDDVNNIVEEDRTSILIDETFNNDRIYDDDNQLDGFFDILVLEKESQHIYEGSKISLLSAILLPVNLRVMNGFSNTCVTQMLRYVMYFFTLSK